VLSSLSRKEEEPPQFFSTVRPEEIPEIPSNKFLFRGSPPKKVEADRYVCVMLYCAFFTHLLVVEVAPLLLVPGSSCCWRYISTIVCISFVVIQVCSVYI